MALIRQPDASRVQRDGVAMDLPDIAREGRAIEEAARRRADEILAAARKERERLVADAAEIGHAEGRNAGYAQGLGAGREEGRTEALRNHSDELARLTGAWTAALDDLARERTDLRRDARQEVLRFAVAFASRIARRAVDLDERSVLTQLEAALELVLRPSRLRIAVHPEDRSAVALAMPALAARFDKAPDWEVVEDAALSRASCVVRSGNGEVDASIETQIDRLAHAALPSGASPPLPPGEVDPPRRTG